MASNLEREFRLRWMAHAGELARVPWLPELRFAPPRRWRFDFALPQARVAVEIEGGVWAQRKCKGFATLGRQRVEVEAVVRGGRHNTGEGFIADCEKYLAAALAGWTVFRLTREMMTRENIEAISAFIAGKLKGIE